MPAKWQLFRPRFIDAWHGSTFVQFSDPAARCGYDYLLDKQWQSEDGTIPDDSQELSEMSGLGVEQWAIHGPRILKKFPLIEPGKRRNEVGFKLWIDAKRIYESRQKAALDTNLKRTQKAEARRLRHDHPTVTVTPSPHRNRNIDIEVPKDLSPTPSAPRKGLDRTGPVPLKSENKTKPEKQGPVAISKTEAARYPHQAAGNSKAPPLGGGVGHSENRAEPAKYDLRWDMFRDEIFKFWAGQNPGGSKCPWGKSEDRALRDLLGDNRGMVLGEFVALLKNRAASKINPSVAPHKWLRDLTQFMNGPLDRFQLPQEKREL